MHSRLLRWLGLVILACLLFGASAGCAQSRDPINRVQAMALDKHFFVGPNLTDPSDDPEFYMGNRIIDEQDGVGQGFWMFQSVGSLARIKWEIQETELVARLTYDRIANTDYQGAQLTDNGQVVAAFKIESHFDIIRDYNPQTGEQLNVIVENTTDRPWYEREYMRVDWSTNLVTDAYDYDLFALGAAIDGLHYDPISYYIEDPGSPDAPVFDGPNGYFDVTTKVFATPQMVDTPYGTFPLCFLFGDYPTDTCNPAEVKVRLSFKKVVDDDYEPEDYDGNKMAAFGWFSVDRYGYDRNYGILDQNWHRFATKYNIWQKSHVDGTQCAVDQWRDPNGNPQKYEVDAGGNFVFDPNTGLPIPDPNGQAGFTKSAVGQDVHRDLDGDGTEDECQFTDANGNVVNQGSRCDEFTNKCDIPLYERQTKTTAFYYGPDAPPDLFAATAHALNSWNVAVKRAVQLGKVVEANRVGAEQVVGAGGQLVDVGNVLTSEDGLLADQTNGSGMTVPDVFVLCHNPVIQGDAQACGPVGLKVRLGDLRYDVVDIIQNPQSPSAWGIMTDFDDPLTGEKVQASINEWAYVLDIASQNVEDLIRWINGEITNDQIANGQYMSQWVQGSQLGTGQYTPPVLSTDEIKRRLNSIDKSLARFNGLTGQESPAMRAKIASQNLAQALGPSMDPKLEGTRQLMLGSQWEAQLLSPEVLQMAGFDPTQPFAGDPATLAMASPLRGMNPRLRHWSQGIIQSGLLKKNMCVFQDEPEPDSLVGMARQAAQLFPLPNKGDPDYPAKLYQRDQSLHQWIREQFHLSVIAHEMGHSMGLRHNFTGSWDALNYHTEYWQLRTNNGKEHYCGYPNALDATTPHTNGHECVGPRWVDPLTDQEINGLIWKWASSTVMDYPGDQTQDMNDIGLYDKAAMRFGYADLVDVENKMNYSTSSDGTSAGSGYDFIGGLQLLDGFGGIFGNSYGNTYESALGNQGNHYSTYNDKYSLLGKCAPRPGWNGDPSDPLAKKCTGSDLDYVARRDMLTVPKLSQSLLQSQPSAVANFAVDGRGCGASGCSKSNKGRVRHPYMFGGDEFADFGNVPVFRFDAGADAYEQMEFLVSTYENRYIFNNFRRNRVTFNTGSVVNALQDRYWDKIKYIAKSLALGIELNYTLYPSSANAPDPTQDPGFLMPMALGTADGFAMFVRAMTRPAPGTYYDAPSTSGSPAPPNPWANINQVFTSQSALFDVGLGNGQGRFLHNDYDYTQGYWWADYQTQVGSYYEKYLAPSYLTEAYNDFISNSPDDYIDGRYKNLSFVSLYPQQVRRLFANLVATQSATLALDAYGAAQIFTLAPYVVQTGGASGGSSLSLQDVRYLPWQLYDPSDSSTTSLQYPSNAVLLDPLVGWEEQYPALINLFWFGPTAMNMDLVDQMRVFSPGDAASLSIPADQQVRYADPVTGIEYVAKNYGTETVNPNIGFPTAKTIGSRMIQHANYLAKIAYQVTNTDATTGELTYATDSQGNPVMNSGQAAQDAATMLKNYASNLDTVRQLTLFYGYGPLGH